MPIISTIPAGLDAGYSIIDTVPSQSGTLTYTGEELTPSWDNYDSEQLTIGGTTSATDAGTYTATFTPNTGYRWADGTQNTVEVTWTITLTFSTTLEDNTWAQISAASEVGIAESLWSVGDTKSVALSGTAGTLELDTTLYVYILGFDHNSDLEGKGISFGCFKANNGTDVVLLDGYFNGYSTEGKDFSINHYMYDEGAVL